MNRILKTVIVAFLALFAGTLFSAVKVEELPLIPAPREIEAGQGKALAPANLTAIHADARSADAAKFLQRLFKQRYKRTLPIVKNAGTPAAGVIALSAGTGKKIPKPTRSRFPPTASSSKAPARRERFTACARWINFSSAKKERRRGAFPRSRLRTNRASSIAV